MGTKKFNEIKKLEYEELKNSLQDGDLFFASGNHQISKMIRKFSNSMFSHVGIIAHWKNRIILLESVEDDGIRAVPLSSYVHNYENTGRPYDGNLYIGRYNKNFSQDEISTLIGAGLDLLNKKYDKAEIISILARISLSLGVHTDNDLYMCSEFVASCFAKIGICFGATQTRDTFPEHIAADRRVQPICEIIKNPA